MADQTPNPLAPTVSKHYLNPETGRWTTYKFQLFFRESGWKRWRVTCVSSAATAWNRDFRSREKAESYLESLGYHHPSEWRPL